jgi:hypothetical protein
MDRVRVPILSLTQIFDLQSSHSTRPSMRFIRTPAAMAQHDYYGPVHAFCWHCRTLHTNPLLPRNLTPLITQTQVWFGVGGSTRTGYGCTIPYISTSDKDKFMFLPWLFLLSVDIIVYVATVYKTRIDQTVQQGSLSSCILVDGENLDIKLA